MEGLNIKKNHPSLPSNYVSIVDLQQRRLKKQQQQIKEEKEQKPQTQNHLKQHDPHQRVDPPPVVVRNYGTAYRNHRAKQYGPEHRNDSAGTRHQSADLNNKGNVSKKVKQKTAKRNPNLENEKKNDIGTSQQRLKISETEAKKSTIESESNEEKKEKKNGDATMVKVEQKFGGLSVNTGNVKKSWGFKRGNGGFCPYQSQRNDFRQFRRHNHEEEKQSGNKMVWVRKDSSVGGEIET